MSLSIFIFISLLLTNRSFGSSDSSDNDDNTETDCNNIDSTANTILSSNLCGDLILSTDGDAYLLARDQYAQSSFPNRIAPSMIVEAECDQDIKSVISYAKQCDFTVVIRSGGHQYDGLSSCNDSCIQIDMSAYNNIEIIDETNIELGPGVLLGDMFEALDAVNLNLPSGECPHVAVGGHAQSGGFGHTLRGQGILIDYVSSFDIILSDGNSYHITRPDPNNPNDFNDDLFRAVIGGSPGSFGVVTNFKFIANNNDDTSTTQMTRCTWQYNNIVFKELFANLIEIQNDPNYLTNPNYGIWWTYAKRDPFATQNVIRVECLWIGLNDEPYDSTICDQLLNSAIQIQPALCETIKTTISDAYLNVWNLERERPFPFPYMNQGRFSDVNLAENFIDLYVDALDEIFLDATNGIVFVSQLVSYGGSGSAVIQNDPDNIFTGLPHRDSLLTIQDALFYIESINANSREISSEWLKTTWNEILDTGAFNNGIDARMAWSTFGNVNINDVWSLYYTQEEYDQLQQVKANVDEINLFQNPFSIPVGIDDSRDSMDYSFSDQKEDQRIDGSMSSKTIREFTLDFNQNTLMNLWGLFIAFILFYTVMCFCCTKKQQKDVLS
eukprot:316242_1